MGVTPRVIELHIEELILEGVDASARVAVADALHARLTELLARRTPSFDADLSISRVAAAPLTVSVETAPQRLGAAIASSVHEGLTR